MEDEIPTLSSEVIASTKALLKVTATCPSAARYVVVVATDKHYALIMGD